MSEQEKGAGTCFCRMPPTMTSTGITHTATGCYFDPEGNLRARVDSVEPPALAPEPPEDCALCGRKNGRWETHDCSAEPTPEPPSRQSSEVTDASRSEGIAPAPERPSEEWVNRLSTAVSRRFAVSSIAVREVVAPLIDSALSSATDAALEKAAKHAESLTLGTPDGAGAIKWKVETALQIAAALRALKGGK